MNVVVMIGRLTQDPQIRTTSTGKEVARFSIAVRKDFAQKDAQVTADFFNVIAWDKRAQTCANYLSKGKQVALRGRLQNNNYTDKTGVKRYSVEIVVDEIQLIDWDDKKTKTSRDDYFLDSSSQREDEFMPEDFQNDKKDDLLSDEDGLDPEGYRALEDDNLPF